MVKGIRQNGSHVFAYTSEIVSTVEDRAIADNVRRAHNYTGLVVESLLESKVYLLFFFYLLSI